MGHPAELTHALLRRSKKQPVGPVVRFGVNGTILAPEGSGASPVETVEFTLRWRLTGLIAASTDACKGLKTLLAAKKRLNALICSRSRSDSSGITIARGGRGNLRKLERAAQEAEAGAPRKVRPDDR